MNKIVGERFGMLEVRSVVRHGTYKCVCDCGNEVEICGDTLRRGKVDCGCVGFKTKDLTGRRFGRLVVLGTVEKNRIANWRCRCDCGNESVVQRSSLLEGEPRSCGCLRNEHVSASAEYRVTNLAGRRFGRWEVIRRSDRKKGKISWLCRCDCGTTREVIGQYLTGGITHSCGCYKRDESIKRLTNPNLTEEDRTKRRLDSRNLVWRLAVYAKGNFVCQICGDYVKGNLVAHHKKAWRSNPEKRFDVDNGVVCCKTHHREFHSFFGYGNNTEDQWNQFCSMKAGVIKMERPTIKRRISVDLVGQKFGRLTVVRPDVVRGKFKWICQCDCGKVLSVYENSLKRGNTKSCGCAKIERVAEMGRSKLKDLTGQRFGKLTVTRRLSVGRWRCKCDCGNERDVDVKYLHNGRVFDCQSVKNGNRCLGRVA